jgi:hypothetical protein
MKPKYKKCFKVAALTYAFLWILTATWGLNDIDRAFDSQFEWAYPNPNISGIGIDGSSPNNLQRVKVKRVYGVNIRDPYGVIDSSNAKNAPKGFWRCRTRGFPIAPFVVLDEAGAQWGTLAGGGGRRLTIWFFGWSHYWWIQNFWFS